MKKIAISLIALATLSTASFASYRDNVIYVGPDAKQISSELDRHKRHGCYQEEHQQFGTRRQQPSLITSINYCIGRAMQPGR